MVGKVAERVRYAKVGELVKIITPRLFIRCGYKLNQEVLLETRYDEIQALVWAAAKAISTAMAPTNSLIVQLPIDSSSMPARLYNQLTSAVCTYIMHKENFGGPERTIHEKDFACFTGITFKVKSKQIVKTGTYVHGSGGYTNYYGEYDYDPPYLENQESHVVYEIDTSKLACYVPIMKHYKILAKHCELLSSYDRRISDKRIWHNHIGDKYPAYHTRFVENVEIFECIQCGKEITEE